MKLSCNTIEDMLPLVVEGLASEDTVKLVNEHVQACSKCNEEYMRLGEAKISYKSISKPETLPLKSIRRKLKNKNIYIGLLSALILFLSLVIALNIATKPIPLSYMEAIESTKLEDGKLFIKFNPIVSNYSIESYGPNHDIMAWKTNISRPFNKGEAKNTLVNIDNENPTTVYYINQTNELDKLIYGKVPHKGRLTLPRLAMNYYLLIMTFLFIIGVFLYLLLKRARKIRRILKIVIIFAFSYILGSLFGSSGNTHHIIRDFCFVLVTSILFFSIIILLVYKESFLNMKRL